MIGHIESEADIETLTWPFIYVEYVFRVYLCQFQNGQNEHVSRNLWLIVS